MFVVPAATPVTTPLVFTVPTAVLELLHAPPVDVVDKVVVVVGHTEFVPVIAAGAVSTDAVMVFEYTGLATRHPTLLSILHDTVLPDVRLLFE